MPKGINYTNKIELFMQEDIIKEIEEMYELGLFDKHIYEYFNIPQRTWFYWKAEGKKIEKKLFNNEITINDLTITQKNYLHLLQISKKGRVNSIKRNLQVIRDAGNNHWQAAAWSLERMDYKHYGRKEKIEVKTRIKIDDKKKKKLNKIFNGHSEIEKAAESVINEIGGKEE